MMETYQRKTECPKCGSGCVTTTYNREQDNMWRKCDGCGFGWSEAPLDSKKKESAT